MYPIWNDKTRQRLLLLGEKNWWIIAEWTSSDANKKINYSAIMRIRSFTWRRGVEGSSGDVPGNLWVFVKMRWRLTAMWRGRSSKPVKWCKPCAEIPRSAVFGFPWITFENHPHFTIYFLISIFSLYLYTL